MSDTRRTIAEVIRIISHLGGPACSEEDLCWAADIPSGKQLLEWLASQGSAAAELCDAGAPVVNALDRVEDPHSAVDETVLGPIALYQDEVDVLGRLRANGVEDSTSLHSAVTPSSYALPSTLRARAEALEHEADALEARAARLQRRSQLAKSATKDARHTLSAVRKQIESAEQAIQAHQERLTDLSIEADSTMGRCTQEALTLLYTSGKQDDQVGALKSDIASFDRARTAIASAVGRLYRALDDGYSTLPPVEELEDDAAVVQARLATTKASAQVPNLIEAAYLEELQRLADKLKASSPGDSQIIDESLRTHSTEKGELSGIFPDVKAELERAGRMDRLLLLQTQEKGLDVAIQELQGTVLPQLQRTYGILHARSAFAAETEAVISALIEELEDINDTVDSTKQKPVGSRGGEEPDDILEAAVTDLLKTLLRSDSGGRPTVLLDCSDVEAEIASLAERSAASRMAEGKWACNTKTRLAELTSSYAPLLSAAYENAPLNTSAPFSAPSAETSAKEDARHKARELTEAAKRLQKESELRARDKRKLAAFVEKWTSVSK